MNETMINLYTQRLYERHRDKFVAAGRSEEWSLAQCREMITDVATYADAANMPPERLADLLDAMEVIVKPAEGMTDATRRVLMEFAARFDDEANKRFPPAPDGYGSGWLVGRRDTYRLVAMTLRERALALDPDVASEEPPD